MTRYMNAFKRSIEEPNHLISAQPFFPTRSYRSLPPTSKKEKRKMFKQRTKKFLEKFSRAKFVSTAQFSEPVIHRYLSLFPPYLSQPLFSSALSQKGGDLFERFSDIFWFNQRKQWGEVEVVVLRVL